MPYSFRYRLSDNGIKASMRSFGALMPVIVTDGKRPLLIAGHKRFYAAQRLKIKELPALVVKKLKPRDAFLLCLISNWRQVCSETDRAKALGIAVRKFRFSEKEVLSIVMPLLGLMEDKAVLDLYLKVDQFPSSLKDLVEDGQLPLRGVTFLLKFSKKDQEYFARKICNKAKSTSSQLLQVGEWLLDIMKGTKKNLEQIFREHKVLECLNVSGMDPRTKADRFFARIKQLRFPGYSLYLKEFEERRSDILRDAREVRLEPIQGFEEPGFELHARVKTSAELDRLLQKLSKERSALNSLFEIML